MQPSAITNTSPQAYFASMCHEILTPLTTILGVSQILLTPQCPPKKQEQCVTALRDSAAMLKELIEDMLDHARIESGNITLNYKSFCIHDVVQEAMHIMAPRAEEKRLVLSSRLDKTPVQLIGDPLRIRQILLNLLNNAIKFTNSGYVYVHMREISEHQGIARVKISVIDTGMGIKAENLEHIFNKYTQADTSISRQYGGIGLGLSISRELARMMHGDITVKSTPGTGSRFTVILDIPLAEAAQNAA